MSSSVRSRDFIAWLLSSALLHNTTIRMVRDPSLTMLACVFLPFFFLFFLGFLMYSFPARSDVQSNSSLVPFCAFRLPTPSSLLLLPATAVGLWRSSLVLVVEKDRFICRRLQCTRRTPMQSAIPPGVARDCRIRDHAWRSRASNAWESEQAPWSAPTTTEPKLTHVRAPVEPFGAPCDAHGKESRT